MNIFKDFQKNIKDIIASLGGSGKLPADMDLSNITAEAPRDTSHGDIATNVAWCLLNRLK
ncbi:MAG: hypothetical protein JKY84_12060 [Emcibacteraceae bacterium]|nr:hypothetical protein [Emcibacteraceae bacterium]